MFVENIGKAVRKMSKHESNSRVIQNTSVNDISLYNVSGRGFHMTQTYKYGTHMSIDNQVGYDAGTTVGA